MTTHRSGGPATSSAINGRRRSLGTRRGSNAPGCEACGYGDKKGAAYLATANLPSGSSTKGLSITALFRGEMSGRTSCVTQVSRLLGCDDSPRGLGESLFERWSSETMV